MGVGIVGAIVCPFEDPKIISTDPFNQQTDVSVTETIFVNFDREVESGYAFRNIKVIEHRTNRIIPITKTVTGNQLKIMPKTSWGILYYNLWQFLTTYDVTIPRGAVQSIYGNPLPSDYTFTFTTEEEDVPTPPPLESPPHPIFGDVPVPFGPPSTMPPIIVPPIVPPGLA